MAHKASNERKRNKPLSRVQRDRKETKRRDLGESRMKPKTKQLIKDMERDTRSVMNTAYNKLCEIIKPINATKLTYTEQKKFMDSNGFNKSWTQIKKIVESHQWLYANCVKRDVNVALDEKEGGK